jgi:hypothetical protein
MERRWAIHRRHARALHVFSLSRKANNVLQEFGHKGFNFNKMNENHLKHKATLPTRK